MNHSETKLGLAIDLSRRIIECARQQEWPEVERLDRERMGLLEELFSGGAIDREDEATVAQLQSLSDLNDEALQLCARAKEAVMSDGRKLQRGKKAVSAYLKG
jgi:hypothetical protein